MSIRSWLRHLAHTTERVRRYFLHALFRRPVCPRHLTTPSTARDAATPRAASAPLDEHQLRLLATEPLCVTSSYEDWLARQAPSLHSPAHVPEESLFFPLDEYRAAVRTGLAAAEEWVHYCRVDRRLAVDLFLHAPASPPAPARDEDEARLVIHATRDESSAPPGVMHE